MRAIAFDPKYLSFIASGAIHLGLLALLAAPLPMVAQSEAVVEVAFIKASTNHGTISEEMEIQSPDEPKIKTVKKEKSATRKESLSTKTEANDTQQARKENFPASGGEEVAASAQESYIADITRILNSKKKYPLMAKKLRQQGRVLVQFLLARDGRVIKASVVEPSVYPALNQSAHSLIRELKGLKPFPDEVKKMTWLFSVPVDYQM